MIYVCIPSYNEAETIGLVLWKIRKVFEEFPREYQILVADDGSTDRTAETLEPYTKVLPLTVIRWETRRGYAHSVEALLHQALELSDRPKRDSALLMHADFTHGPQYLPDFVRRLDSGADLVVGEGTLAGEPSAARRLVRHWAPRLLRRAVRVRGVTDTVSGFVAFRLMVLRQALTAGGRGAATGGTGRRPLTASGWAANAELIGRAAHSARRIETVRVLERHDLRTRPSRIRPWETLRELWRSGTQLKRRQRAAGAAS
ncbi:MAG TPA: glycosyltransferase family 2 protein [Gemmatimonadales bacterium]|nr:glycosyltransferase family 2 protein [Gemmatimonadales bacterium]